MTLCTRIAGRPGSSRTRSVAPNRWQPRDYDRLEAGLIELGHNRDFKDARKGSGRNYRSGVFREDVWRARENLQSALTGFRGGRQCRPCGGAAPGTSRLRGAYEAAKTKSGALDFLDLLLKTRNLIRDNAERALQLPTAFQAHLRR